MRAELGKIETDVTVRIGLNPEEVNKHLTRAFLLIDQTKKNPRLREAVRELAFAVEAAVRVPEGLEGELEVPDLELVTAPPEPDSIEAQAKAGAVLVQVQEPGSTEILNMEKRPNTHVKTVAKQAAEFFGLKYDSPMLGKPVNRDGDLDILQANAPVYEAIELGVVYHLVDQDPGAI